MIVMKRDSALSSTIKAYPNPATVVIPPPLLKRVLQRSHLGHRA
jgi:hypothetical protein